MRTKSTIRSSKIVAAEAGIHATRCSNPIMQVLGDLIASLRQRRAGSYLPPVTSSLLGIMKGHRVNEADYHQHLHEKHRSR